MSRSAAVVVAVYLSLQMPLRTWAQPPTLAPIPAPTSEPASLPSYTITLHARHACATPHSQKLARADGGFIDVASPTPNVIVATMTGTVAANSYLGCTGIATETFQLVQEFEITCSDPAGRTVALTLDTSLAGFVRSKGRAGACVRRAEVSVTPTSSPGSPMVLAYPSLSVEGTGGQLCNQHLPPLNMPAMPIGRYTLVATFVLDTRASGVCDSHAVADFSPDTSLPAEWVRARDPFQSVSKKSFGFTATVTASPPAAGGQPMSKLESARPPLAAERDAPASDPTNRRSRRTPYEPRMERDPMPFSSKHVGVLTN